MSAGRSFDISISDEQDSDDDQFETIVPNPSFQAARPVRRVADDDRPITPMKNTMVYSNFNSSLDFDEGMKSVL